MRDYTFFFREEMPIAEEWPFAWDIFLSGYTPSDRVSAVYGKVKAKEKHWIVHNEYNYASIDHLTGSTFSSDCDNEADFVLELCGSKLAGIDLSAQTICIDITGLMRPHMMFLIKYLAKANVKKLDILYSEPSFYASKERTQFSLGSVKTVRQVAGFEGIANADTSRDLLLIGAGYESHLIAEVAEDKERARKLVILGLPSLSCDMYQQNAWRTRLTSDSIGETATLKFFAPANDPFATATILSEIVTKESADAPITNLYLSPLATKAQALGFVIFYLGECETSSSSIIFPFSDRYSAESAKGIARIWKYTLEFL